MSTIISIVNHKGGTGKTTTTINLGKALSLRGKSVLLIDLDSQANLSYSLGIGAEEKSIGDVLFRLNSPQDIIVRKEGMDVMPANNNLYQYEESIIKNEYGHYLLKDILSELDYDFILIDCPPSQSQLNINALCAANKVLVPMLLDVLSLQGLNQILKTIEEVKEKYNPELEILGVLGVLVDERRQLTRDILEHVQRNYPVTVFNNHVRANVKAAEAPSHGVSLVEYAPSSHAATDYMAVANELLKIYEN
jgi:chromosome partitioning protein